MTLEEFIARGIASELLQPHWVGPVLPITGTPSSLAAFVVNQIRLYGLPICKDRGHDYTIRVAGTSNMYLCFRCGEPGWEVPSVEPTEA